MGDINLAGHSPATIKKILAASNGQCRCCRAKVNTRPWGASSRRVHTVSEDDLRGGRDVPALMCVACATAMDEGGFTSVVDFVFSARPACPECGARKACTIGYGMPSYDWIMNMSPWESSGGCVVGSNSPQWRCGKCAHEWGVKVRRPFG